MDSDVATQLASDFVRLPQRHHYRWNDVADRELRQILFRSLARQNETYFRFFFPEGRPKDESKPWSLKEAQGAVDGAEYLPSARGTACGHIFKSGESTYACKTCASDESCVLCTKCFESSDHVGHQVYIQISPGNSGCCDCGDHEAWKKDVICSIHTDPATLRPGHKSGKGKEQQGEAMDTSASSLPHDLVAAIRTTIARSLDFICDIFSCSPEQMRMPKTEASVRQDEERSRLSPALYGIDESNDPAQEFCMVLWNDEKHTIEDVQNQVARACAQSKTTGRERAIEINDHGRSIIYFSTDIKKLIDMAVILEQLKLTVTIRASRDIFREQMCAAIVDWLSDVSGCAVGPEPTILRNIICEELLQPWRTGSKAGNKAIGAQGIYDHQEEEYDWENKRHLHAWRRIVQPDGVIAVVATEQADNNESDDFDDDDDDNIDEADDLDEDDLGFEADDMDLDTAEMLPNDTAINPLHVEIELAEDEIDVTEVMEARHAGYPAPPPPPRTARQQQQSPNDSDDADLDAAPSSSGPFDKIPKTPKAKVAPKKTYRAGRHWLETPDAFKAPQPTNPSENLWQRIRLDWMILYDLRLWKTLRTDLRHLYITTVIVIPQFKRILGLRFASLYTPLAELYLIADREPDHSIINLSIQMLTTPTITEEVVERGNFLANLMAVLYTFLTTRQVGYPDEVNPKATLAFDAGTVTNRRMFHFFMDLRWLFQSEFIQRRMRNEYRYLLQFLELVRLHQGICPNVRAVGDHVEYESDAWIHASFVIKEINRLCRQMAISFRLPQDGPIDSLPRAVRTVAQVALSSTLGFERRRFSHAEIKNPLTFHNAGPLLRTTLYRVPKHVVQKEHISFHHPLHYLLSWLIEHGVDMDREDLRRALSFSPQEFKDPLRDVRLNTSLPSSMTPNLFMSVLFDPPVRVVAWLAQSKAGMWVRNGVTLRHQANSYRSVTNRDTGYQRDLFMIQTGLTLLPGNQPSNEPIRDDSFLAQMIDRFQMTSWMTGNYAIVEGFEEGQQLDVLEDFYHLLVIVLCERSHLFIRRGEPEVTDGLLEHDIAHVLCFKPLSFSDITSRLTEKVHDADNFSDILERMATYKAPEGLSDVGVFELKPEYIELVDPYFAHFTRNAREEAENVYRRYKARLTGQRPDEIVYEPRLQAIESGVFKDLTMFTRGPLFGQILYAALVYCLEASKVAPNIPATRIETFLHMVLHLTMIAVLETPARAGQDSFITMVHDTTFVDHRGKEGKILAKLEALYCSETLTACQPTIKRIFQLMLDKQANIRLSLVMNWTTSADKSRTNSPAGLSAEEREKKKKAALARQAKVMAQMKEQQNSFLKNQGLTDLEPADDLDDFDDKMSITHDEVTTSGVKQWSFPTGTCILCQEATDDDRTFGTFAYIDNSNILRTTPMDLDYVDEILSTPADLDQPYPDRPFGVASENKLPVLKTTPDGTPMLTHKQQLAKGFPQGECSISGPVSTSCGHMMHYKCFENYYNATTRRHQQQIARSHPEDVFLNEFICPLCKALGNTFLPVVWKTKDCESPSALSIVPAFSAWMQHLASNSEHYPMTAAEAQASGNPVMRSHEKNARRLQDYAQKSFPTKLIEQLSEKSVADDDFQPVRASRSSLRRLTSMSSLFRPSRGLFGSGSSGEGRLGLSRESSISQKHELGAAYTRAHDSFICNKLVGVGPATGHPPSIEVVMVLAHALGMSISACEIAQRGTPQSALADGLIDAIPEQTVTHLRVVSETAETALAVSGLDGMSCSFGIEVQTVDEMVKLQGRLRQQVFGNGEFVDKVDASKVMLASDSFLTTTNWLVAHCPDLPEAINIIRIGMWAEVVKTVFVLCESTKAQGRTQLPSVDVDEPLFNSMNFLLGVIAAAAGRHPEAAEYASPLEGGHYIRLAKAIETYALAYLRKCSILLYVRHGVSLTSSDEDLGFDELTRTCRMLHIEHPLELLRFCVSDGPAAETLRILTDGWINAAFAAKLADRAAIKLPHPAIFELIGLPSTYDALTEEAIRRRCPTKGREITDPAICLFCGDIFCSQAVCCSDKEDRGGCWQHMQKCGVGNIGIFINIRKCMVLLMHGSNGSFLHAPYLDKHGEPDPTLRRHHQLFLNQKRYDKLLRDVWLAHGVQNVISRKLEADVNPGGWETL